jgi:hypothetical protein
MRTKFWLESLKGEDHSEYLRVDGKDNTKMDLKEMGFGDVDGIHLAQDRDRWMALVNTVINPRVP